MSLPSRSRRAVLALALFAPLLAACTLTPVHGDRGPGAGQIALRYADPASRLEQVFYQALSQRLPASRDPQAPLLSASVSASAARVGLSVTVGPLTDYQVVATARYTLSGADGKTLASGTRTATSGYRTTGQVLADDEARANAQESAMRAVAEAVRLALLAETQAR